MKINKNILLILSGLVVAIAPQAQEIKVKDKIVEKTDNT